MDLQLKKIPFTKYTVEGVALLFLICLVLSCQNKQQNKDVPKYKTTINSILGTQLQLPTNLTLYDYLNDYKSDSIGIFNSEFKIYSRVNASCELCVDHINQWSELNQELNKYNTSIILMCYSDDNNFKLLKLLCESGEIKKFQYPLFLDMENRFVKLNTFMKEHEHFETVLTDKNDNILATGNPILLKGIEGLYFNEIQKSF